MSNMYWVECPEIKTNFFHKEWLYSIRIFIYQENLFNVTYKAYSQQSYFRSIPTKFATNLCASLSATSKS